MDNILNNNPKISKKIGDFFVTDKEVGRGSFGGVFLGYPAKDSSTQVAIKILPIYEKNKEDVDRYYYEMKILTSLNHPNLVKLLGSFATKEHLYLIFDYCKDGNLYEYCKNQQKRNPYNSANRPILTEYQSINFFKQIVAGYFHLFQNKITHRDLKPQNIFLHAGCLKIGDFGLAKQFSQRDQQMLLETKCGTPLYMAPEINIEGEYNSYCDMWSLGVIFYEMLYGKTPWNGVSEYNLFHNIENTPLSFPENIIRNERVKEILKRTLVKEPEKRMKWEDFFKSVELLDDNPSALNVKGNLINKNIKIFQEDYVEQFKGLDLKQKSPREKTPKNVYEGVSLIDEDFNKLVGFKQNQIHINDKKYEKIQNGRDYMFYNRNIATLFKKTNGIFIDLFRQHRLSMSNDLFYKIIFLLQSASYFLMKKLMMICKNSFIENEDLSVIFFESAEFKQIKKEIEDDFQSSEFEMKNIEETLNEVIQKWLKDDKEIVKNIEFISLVRDDRKELNSYFVEMYENTIKCFLDEQHELFQEDLIQDKDILKLLRYMQICNSVENIYKVLQRVDGEDNSQIFFSLYDFLDNATLEDLLKLLSLEWKKIN